MKCNGGGSLPDTTATPVPKTPPKRIGFQALNSAGITLNNSVVINLTWNHDILAQSLYHSAFGTTAVTDGTAWCSAFLVTAKKDGTETTFVANKGFDAATKCTWLIQSEDSTVGPTFSLKTAATYNDFILQWTEWINTAALNSDGIMPADDTTSNYYPGAYPATEGVFLNPLEGKGSSETTWPITSTKWAISTRDPTANNPGSFGQIMYYPAFDGPFKESDTDTQDSAVLLRQLKAYKDQITAYNTAKAAYDTKRTAYDTAIDNYTKREADIFAKAFTPEVKIPARPVAPVRPAAYTLPSFGLADSVAASSPLVWGSTATSMKGAGLITWINGSAVTQAPSDVFSNKRGFIQVSTDVSTFVPANYASTGHVFGLLGQGAATMPGASAPFVWKTVAATDKAGLLVSIFPSSGNAGGALD